MNDLNYLVESLAQFATGEITYNTPVGADYASGIITYNTPVAAANASIQMTITDYTQLVGKTVTVDGNALVEGVDWTAATDNNTTGTSLAAAIDGLGSWIGAGPGLVTATFSTKGTAGNGKSVTTDAVSGIDIDGNGVSGGTTAGGVDGDTVAVGGTTFTCVDSSPGANEFSNITELEALVEAVANIDSVQDGSVVNITYSSRGIAGNAVTLALGGANAGDMAISGATLSGGVDGDIVTVDGNAFTCVVGTAGASEFSSITELEVLVEAVAGINSTQDGTTVSMTADEPGTDGNALTLALGGSNAGDMAISGATFSGGVDSTETGVMTIEEGTEVLKTAITVANLTSGAVVQIIPQTSMDELTWVDLPGVIISANGDYNLETAGLLTYVRYGLYMGGTTSPTADVTIKGIQSNVAPVTLKTGAITSLDAALFNATTSRNGSTIDCSQADEFLLFLDLDSTGSPTNVQISVQFSDDDGTTWYPYEVGAFTSMFFIDAQMPKVVCYSGKCVGNKMRVSGVSAGTDGSNYFDVTAKIQLG